MIKIQTKDFNIEEEIANIKINLSEVWAITTFIGYVRANNNSKKVNSINLEVYENMAKKYLANILIILMK